MSRGDDIRAGDVVACIETDMAEVLSIGALYRVVRVFRGYGDDGEQGVGVAVRGVQPPLGCFGFDADCFEKLRPAEDCFSKAMKSLIPLEVTVT